MNHFRVIFYFSVLMLFSSITAFAQDTIVKRSNEIVLCKVVEVGDTEINYKRQNNLNGPIYVIQITDVAVIKYGSGAKDIFNTFDKQQTDKEAVKEKLRENQTQSQPAEQKQETIENKQDPEDEASAPKAPLLDQPYRQGQLDAEQYYKKYKPAALTTLFTSLGSPIAGLGVAIVCSSVRPKAKNFRVPNPEYRSNPVYMKGYQQKAHSIKRRKVWRNFLFGAAGGIVLTLLSGL